MIEAFQSGSIGLWFLEVATPWPAGKGPARNARKISLLTHQETPRVISFTQIFPVISEVSDDTSALDWRS